MVEKPLAKQSDEEIENQLRVNPDLTATPMTDFTGRPVSDVAQVIFDTAKGKYGVKSGGDVDVWKVLK